MRCLAADTGAAQQASCDLYLRNTAVNLETNYKQHMWVFGWIERQVSDVVDWQLGGSLWPRLIGVSFHRIRVPNGEELYQKVAFECTRCLIVSTLVLHCHGYIIHSPLE